MTENAYVVQFPHPGGERLPKPLAGGATMPWNTDTQHGRKFLLSPATWTNHAGETHQGQVTFWGEWEPQSEVLEMLPSGPGLPRALQRPWYAVEDTGWRQNTDPLVFGDRFSYTNCRQGRNKKLRNLPAGTVALFGSKVNHDFVLDTVLVVASAARWQPADGPPPDAGQGADALVADPISRDPNGDGLTLTWYSGATRSQPIDGMYSFVPALPYQPGQAAFARPHIRLEGLITPNLAMAAKVTPSQARDAWERVVEQVFDAGLVLATDLPTPEHRQPAEVVTATRRAGQC
jgi:hypothetical protein